MTSYERIGYVDRVALATGRAAVDICVHRGIDLRVYPNRGLDVGAGWFRGFPLACSNVGAASDGIELHRTYTFFGARDLDAVPSPEEVTCRTTIDEPRGLRVQRTIKIRFDESHLEVIDRTSNFARRRLEAPILYHLNLGWPLWDEGARVETDANDVIPRDDHAARHSWVDAPLPTAAPQRVWEHSGATQASVVNERVGLRVTVQSDLPRFWQWVDPTPRVYALGLEPANCSVLDRAHDRGESGLPMLEPGEERTTRISIRAEMT